MSTCGRTGFGGQFLLVIPAQDTVAVVNSVERVWHARPLLERGPLTRTISRWACMTRQPPPSMQSTIESLMSVECRGDSRDGLHVQLRRQLVVGAHHVVSQFRKERLLEASAHI